MLYAHEERMKCKPAQRPGRPKEPRYKMAILWEGNGSCRKDSLAVQLD